VARRIDLCELGDRGDLTKQPERVESALIESSIGPRQLRGPAHLAFDLGNEFLDFVGGRDCLLLLDIDQRALVLLIREPDLESAIGNERQHDHGDE
jgi:hypothetical protein